MMIDLLSPRRSLLTASLASLALLLPAQNLFAQNAASDPGLLLPEETSAVATIRDLSVFTELDESHPVKKFLAHPSFAQLIESFTEEIQDDEEVEDADQEEAVTMPELIAEMETDLGLEKDELARLFPGSLTIAGHFDINDLIPSIITDPAAFADPAGSKATVTLGISDAIGGVMIAETTASEDRLAEIFQALADTADAEEDGRKVRFFRETVDGQSLHKLEFPLADSEDYYPITMALVDDRLVCNLSPQEDYFDDVVRRTQSGGKESGSLANDTGYLDARDRLLESDFFIFVGLEEWMQALNTAISEGYAAMSADGPNPVTMMVPEANVLRVLGLEDFRRMTFAGKILPDGMEYMQEIAFNERTGMFSSIFSSYGSKPIDLPDFDPAGMTTLSVTTFDLGNMLEQFLAYIPQISPMAGGMVDMQLTNFEQQGVRLRDGIIPGLGEGMTVIKAYPTPTPEDDELPSQVFLINCDDPTGLAGALEELQGFLATQMGGSEEPETRKFLGVTVTDVGAASAFASQLAPGTPDPSVAYAFIDNQLVVSVGSPKMMDHAITSLKKKGNDIEAFELVGESWRRWEMENLVSFTYMDVATYMKEMLYSMREGASVPVSDDGVDVASALQDTLEDFPSLDDMHFYLIDKSYQTDDALVGRGFFGEKPTE